MRKSDAPAPQYRGDLHVRGQTELFDHETKKRLYATVAPESDRDMCRPEFKAETEIPNVLRQYMGRPPVAGAAMSGDRDMNVTLQELLAAQEAAASAFERLPEAVRSRYGSWEALAMAAARGEILPEAEAPAGASAGASAPEPSPKGAAG